MSRLSPSTQAFLERRAAARRKVAFSSAPSQAAPSQAATATYKAATAVQQPAAAGTHSATAMEQPPTATPAGKAGSAGRAQEAGQEDTANSLGTANKTGTAGIACTAGTVATTGKAGSVHQQAISAQRRHMSSGERDTGANSSVAVTEIISRLRFSLEGQVVGLKAVTSQTQGPAANQQVVSRDIIRYTLNMGHNLPYALTGHAAL